ncbi:MAG: hemerythrin domain-containing protein [Deltaproteobacteria bacterium]|nr:hemerythrin domain-containing protein [Deltaproteobacteria bacterium]
MDIIEALKEDHKKVKAMFEVLEKSTTAASKKRVELLGQLEADLRRHMKFEEEVFYPAIKAVAHDTTSKGVAARG